MEIVENLNNRYIRKSFLQERDEGLEGYRVRMLQANKIPGLVKVDRRCLDGCTYLYYDITRMRSMQEKEPVINVEMMDAFVEELEQLLGELEEYLLVQQEVCLRPEYIWSDEKIGKWRFVYIPEYKSGSQKDIEGLLEFLMDHIDSRDENGLERFYDFYSDALQCLETLTISEIIRLWKKGEPKKDRCEGIIGTVQRQTEEREGESYKGKIYSVPFRGTKVFCQEDVTLT